MFIYNIDFNSIYSPKRNEDIYIYTVKNVYKILFWVAKKRGLSAAYISSASFVQI